MSWQSTTTFGHAINLVDCRVAKLLAMTVLLFTYTLGGLFSQYREKRLGEVTPFRDSL